MLIKRTVPVASPLFYYKLKERLLLMKSLICLNRQGLETPKTLKSKESRRSTGNRNYSRLIIFEKLCT